MLRIGIRFSKSGTVAACIFLALAAATFSWIFFVASKNPGDSGESGLLLLPFAMPWISLLPISWIGPLAGIGAIFLNALILFLVCGGIRIGKPPKKSEEADR